MDGCYDIGDFAVGHHVRAFHPGTLGVAHWATVLKVGRKNLTVRWHVTDRAGTVPARDVLERRGTHE